MTMAKKADDKVMKLRETLLAKRAELANAEKPVYKAGEFFTPNVNNARGEFQVAVANSNQLLNGVKAVLLHEQSAKVLGMDVNYQGFPVSDWIEDFKTRKAVLDKNTKLLEIKNLEDQLKPLLTKEQLREIGISDLADAIESL